jgi:hypothetical protein
VCRRGFREQKSQVERGFVRQLVIFDVITNELGGPGS